MIYTIYKIVCEDPNVKYRYVGSTRSFRHRKAQHKSNCNNENREQYNNKLYTTIRENGGWNNFRMVVIAEVEVNSKTQAEIIEEEHRLKLQANLNEKRCHRTEQQKRECDKLYRENNTEKVKEYLKEYYENNTEKITQYNKEYYENNAEKIKHRQNTKCNCKCGGKYTNANKTIHLNTKKHKKYLEQNKDI